MISPRPVGFYDLHFQIDQQAADNAGETWRLLFQIIGIVFQVCGILMLASPVMSNYASLIAAPYAF